MVNIVRGAVLVIGVLVLQGCTSLQCGSSKSQFIENFERFVEEARREELSVTDTEWKVYDDRLANYIMDCYTSFEEDMTFSDRQEVLSLAIEYYYLRYGSHMIRELQNADNPVSVKLMEELEKTWSDPKELLREVLGEDWNEMVNEFMEDLDKWKLKLKQWLEEQEAE